MNRIIDGTNYQTKTQKLKKTYVDKIVSFLSKKYAGFFKDKNYTIEQLTKDVTKNLSDNDMKTFNMSTGISRFEKMTLEKISKMESKKSTALKMDKIKNLLSTNNKINSNNNNISSLKNKQSLSHPKKVVKGTTSKINEEQQQQQRDTLVHNLSGTANQIKNINELPSMNSTEYNNSNHNKQIQPYLTEKMELLKLKQNDKWAKIANADYAKYIQEQENKRMLIEKQKQAQKQFLEQQIKEKELQKQKHKQEETDYYNKNKNTNPFIHNNIKDISNKHLLNNNNNINPHSLQYKQQQKQIENQKYNEQLQNEINAFNKEEERKRIEKREMYLKMQKENEELVKSKRSVSYKNNSQHDQQVEEFFPFGKNDSNYNRRYRIDMNNINELSSHVNQKEIVKKAYEAQKLKREIEERIKREEENDKFKREQKIKMINDYKQGLDLQISEKNILKSKINNDIKTNDLHEIQKINKEIMEEQSNNERIKLDKQHKYKQSLDEQVLTNKKQYQYD